MRRTGDWAKVARLIGNMSKEMKRAQELSLKRFALKAEGTAKKHISDQDLGWAALKAATVADKKRKGYSDKILVRTSDYFQAITSYTLKDHAYIGVLKVAKNKDGNVIANIAAVHEFGSPKRNIPERPLWKPTLDETITWAIKNNDPRDILRKNLRRYL